MNVTFADKLSHDTWHNTMCSTDAHREALFRWIAPFISGAWCYADPLTDIPVRPGSAEHPRPDNRHQTGTVSILQIRVNPNDCYLTDAAIGYGWHGPNTEVYPGLWCAGEFSWVVYTQPVTEYGGQDPGYPYKHVVHGGLINHGSHNEPSWSSHT